MARVTETRAVGAAWGWVAITAAAGALVSVSVYAQVLLGSGYGRLWSGVGASLAGAALAGAAAGALLALPGALPRRPVHPSFGLWLLLLFGGVDWPGDTEGALRWTLQGMLLVLVTAGAVALRNAGARLGVVAGAALGTMAIAPVGVLLWKNVSVPAQAAWFEDREFAERIVGAARARAGEASPDLWLVMADGYPSPAEAARRGMPYPVRALAELRDRGWRIREDASTPAPHTTVTLAQTLALTTRLVSTEPAPVNAGASRPSRGLEALFLQNGLDWQRSIVRPLLFDALESAGYDTFGYLGWWWITQYLPFDHTDRTQSWSLDTLHEVAIRRWVSMHTGGRAGSWWNEFFRSFEQNCPELAAQRERFFALETPVGAAGAEREPLFVFYHLFWLHDRVDMDVSGHCRVGESNRFDLPPAKHIKWDASCQELQGRGEAMGWAWGCLPEHVRDVRAARMIAYLPAFLARLERHAQRVAGNRPFRILVFADEGISGRQTGGGRRHPGAWRTDTLWERHPAVLRAEFGHGVARLWEEHEIPDLPRAMREVISDAFLQEG